MFRRRNVIAGMLVGGIVLVTFLFWHSLSSPPPKRAFYHWKTQWYVSPALLTNLTDNRIDRLYMRFFDVEWDDIENIPRPVSPLRFQSPSPTGVEVVPVVYIVNAAFLKMPYDGVEGFADRVLAM